MLNNVILLNSFAIVRQLRYKYKLSFNCIMILNGIYIYSLNKPLFTLSGVCRFIKYYDQIKIYKYGTVLLSRGFIHLDKEKSNEHIRKYYIDPVVKDMMKELSDNYNRVVSDYLLCYPISL